MFVLLFLLSSLFSYVAPVTAHFSSVCVLQVQDLTDQVKSKGDTEDEIMIAVNNKVEEWKVSNYSVPFSNVTCCIVLLLFIYSCIKLLPKENLSVNDYS